MILKLVFICTATTFAGVVGFMLTVISGNIEAMKFLAKNGVAMFSGDINKDYDLLEYVNKDALSWIKAPNICYAPIMKSNNGKYRDHNFLSKENANGEIFLSDGNNSKALSRIARSEQDGYVLKDLSIIEGSKKGNSRDMRNANFSNLRGFCDYTHKIEIYDNGTIRKFRVLAVIDQYVGEMTSVSFSSRDEFLKSILDNASYKVNFNYNQNILILMSKDDVVNILALLIEVKE